MKLKRVHISFVLLMAPILLVLIIKNSGSYGPLLATPQVRQQGDPHAKVIIVEYSDFQCPSCAHIQPFLKDILATYKGNVRLYFKYYPLTMIHKNALTAAHAAECAARQNKFWPYGEKLFERQNQWAPLADATTHYMAIAQDVGLNAAAFQACQADPSVDEAMIRDTDEAQHRAVNATPTFFVNDERLVGGVFESDGARTIERELRK
jgi:protein-disulfide isomerase